MVAPNSPIALAKQRIMPAMMPGRISGSVMVPKTQAGLAPSVPAAASSRRSTASIDRRMARTISGKAMTPQARCCAGPAEREDDAEILVQEGADRTALAEGEQQQIAGHHRRQDQRQMNEPVEHGLAPEFPARQQAARSGCRAAG